MPALPPVPKVAQFTIHTQITGGPICLTRFFMAYTGALGQVDATTLCNTLATSWGSRFRSQTGSVYSLEATQVLDLNSHTGVDVIVPESMAGTSGDVGVPAATAFVMSAHVALRYRGGHSRVYIPGLSQTGLTDRNTWSTAFQGTINTAWTGMLSDLNVTPPAAVGTLSQVAVHRYSSNLADFGGVAPSTKKPPWPLASPVVYAITGWSSNPQVGSQRRRNQQ